MSSELLRWAVEAKDASLVGELLNYTSVINDHNEFEETILWTALKKRHVDIAIMLLRAGLNNNNNVKYIFNDSKRESPLHFAIALGCDELTKLLILYGADVNAQDAYGNSVLHQAMYYNASVGIVIELLKYGAKIDVRNKNGEYVMSAAAKSTKAMKVVIKLLNWDNPNFLLKRKRAILALRMFVYIPNKRYLSLLHNLLSVSVLSNVQTRVTQN